MEAYNVPSFPPHHSPTIILVRPQLPENGGAVARVMKNFGLTLLRLVDPHFLKTDPKALAMSAGADAILENALIYNTLNEAVGDLSYIYGTCAVERLMIKKYAPVREAMSEISTQASVGIVFGPERTGLTNDELALFRKILHIPVDPAFKSLNLAQSVAIAAYEWYQTQNNFSQKLRLGETQPAPFAHVQGFLTMLEKILDDHSFWRINHKKPIMWRNLQNIFTRMDLTEQEVRTLHGMVRSLTGDYEKKS